MNGMRVQGTPFAPGRAQGILRRGRRHSAPDVLLVLSHQELRHLETPSAAGFIVTDAAPLSHPMIRLLGSGAPVVVMTLGQGEQLPEGAQATIDGGTGWVCVPPEGPVGGPALSIPVAGKVVRSADDQPVALRASVADARGAQRARACGATAIGLVRSEFLVPGDGSAPDTEFYVHALGDLCRAAHPLPVTVRLLDIAADKLPPWMPVVPGMEGPLGLQGVRLYTTPPVAEVLQAQLDALGVLAPEFDLLILLPYVVRPEEFRYWRREIERRLPVPLAVGTMAETPAAVLSIRDWMEMADFVAIGCNDLLQCLFAADRDRPEVGGLLDPYAPVVFRVLREAAMLAGDEVAAIQLCGLLPQAPGILPVLLGLGFRTYSVEPVLVPYLARVVGKTDTRTAEALAAGVCAEADADSVRALLDLPAASAWGLGAGGAA